MNKKTIAMTFLAFALVLMPMSVFADVEKDITPENVRTVYQGLSGSPLVGYVPQGAVSRARRYESRYLPSDLQGQQHAVGNIQTSLYDDYKISGPESVRGSPGIAFGWPPSSVAVSLRFGAQDNSKRAIQSKLGVGVKQPKYSQVRLTEKPVVGSLICCDRELIELNGATNRGKCDLNRLKTMKPEELNQYHWKLGSNEYFKSIVKSACGSNPGYRYALLNSRITACMNTDQTVCQAPADLP